jgi:hypothetical protein
MINIDICLLILELIIMNIKFKVQLVSDSLLDFNDCNLIILFLLLVGLIDPTKTDL